MSKLTIKGFVKSLQGTEDEKRKIEGTLKDETKGFSDDEISDLIDDLNEILKSHPELFYSKDGLNLEFIQEKTVELSDEIKEIKKQKDRNDSGPIEEDEVNDKEASKNNDKRTEQEIINEFKVAIDDLIPGLSEDTKDHLSEEMLRAQEYRDLVNSLVNEEHLEIEEAKKIVAKLFAEKYDINVNSLSFKGNLALSYSITMRQKRNKDKVSEDKVSEDKVSEDKVSEDKVSEAKVSGAKVSEDKASGDKNTKKSWNVPEIKEDPLLADMISMGDIDETVLEGNVPKLFF